ncbi:hypothetical protein GGU11DRAFT_758927 [Lentinula aff. detonsa]|nr:hypothetical protein GGU11DRAFT_758927 [Lentinula aff. detonsa]
MTTETMQPFYFWPARQKNCTNFIPDMVEPDSRNNIPAFLAGEGRRQLEQMPLWDGTTVRLVGLGLHNEPGACRMQMKDAVRLVDEMTYLNLFAESLIIPHEPLSFLLYLTHTSGHRPVIPLLSRHQNLTIRSIAPGNVFSEYGLRNGFGGETV